MCARHERNQNELRFFYLDGFSWTDLLDFLGVPHYSNEHREDSEAIQLQIRTVELPECGPTQLVVTWTGELRPTDAQILELVAVEDGEAEDEAKEAEQD